MTGLADLLRPRNLTNDLPPPPPLMRGEVIDIAPLRATIAALDGRLRAHNLHGTYPDAVAGDAIWVMHDEDGELVAVSWEPT